MDLVELAPGMGPAGRLVYMVAVQMMKSGIGIGLQGAGEVLQMLARMFTLAIFRVGEPDSGRGLFARRPVVAHISPETSGLGLAVAGREHRHRRIVGMQLAAGEHMLLNRIDQRGEQIAGCTNPAGQRRARDLHSLAGINLRLPEERQVVSVLRDDAHEPAAPVRQGRVRSAAMAPALQPRDRSLCRRTSAAHGG